MNQKHFFKVTMMLLTKYIKQDHLPLKHQSKLHRIFHLMMDGSADDGGAAADHHHHYHAKQASDVETV